MPRLRIDDGQEKVPDEEDERDVHQPVVHEERVRRTEARVALAVPEEEAGDDEEQGERGGDHRVQLLPCVQAALRGRPALQPRAVVGVEAVDLPRGANERAPVSDERDHDERDRPGNGRVDVDPLHERTAADHLGEARQVEAEPGAEQDQERGRVHPVHGALGAREPRESATLRCHSRSTSRPTRSGRSRALPSSPSAGGRRAPSASAT